MTSTYAESLESLVGQTPLLALRRLAPPGGARLWVKLGAFNPTGSDDDRAAAAWFHAAEARGAVTRGGRLVVPSLGNFAISLAWLCASRGLSLTAVVPDHVTLDRRALLRAYGAEVVLVPAEGGLEGARTHARGLAEARGALLVDAHSDLDGPFISAAFESLGGEITAALASMGAAAPDAVVAGLSPGPALEGLTRAVRAHFPACRVIGVVPARTLTRLQELVPVSAPAAGVEAEPVEDAQARECQERLGREEGLLLGIASSAAVAVARRVAQALAPSGNVVVVCPDSGERDFSLEELFR